MALETFNTAEGESQYLAWIAANPDGFVVNTTRPTASVGYLKLHNATCPTITELQPRYHRFTSGDQQKVCSTELAELERWARDVVGGRLDPCGHCRS